MATSLAAQLAQIAANSKATLDVKAQKAAHSKSLIWEPRLAATQSFQALYTICYPGFEELCQLDSRFVRFQSSIFNESSQGQDRSQLSKAENEELDRHIEAFLRLIGPRMRLAPAVKAIEWLIRRFRIHEENIALLLMAFLPYHSIPGFTTLLSILPNRLPYEFKFLDPYVRSLTNPPRSVLVHQAIHHPEFLSSVSEYTLESCRKQYHFSAQIVFWGGLMTEAVNGLLDRTRSGRAAVHSDNTQALLHRLGPIFAESLVMKKIPSLQIASYMAMAILVSKGNLGDAAVTAFMQQTVHGWTNETVRPGLVCLTIMAQFRSAKQMNGKVTKALMKVQDIGALLVDIGRERRVDKLASGLCLALIERFTKKGDSQGLPTIMAILGSQILKEKQIAVIFKSLLLAALKLDDDNDGGGKLRRELGSALIALSQTAGRSGDIIQSVIEDVEFDIEELEMKLDLSFRAKRLPTMEGAALDVEAETSKRPHDFTTAIDEMSSKKGALAPCLLPESCDVFEELSDLFFSIVSESSQQAELLTRFDKIPKLKCETALHDCTYFSFFIRIWCGPYPALARTAALNRVKIRLQSGSESKVDVQALIPYAVTALSDPSKRVRQAAAHLITVMTELYVPPVTAKSMEIWGSASLYGKTKDKHAFPSDTTAKVLHLQIRPSIEECVMDAQHISAVLKSAIEQGKYQVTPAPLVDKKDHMSQSARLPVLSFFAAHVTHTPLLLVKDRLLKFLNEIKGVGSTSRTQVLLPTLTWWTKLSNQDVAQKCAAEQMDASALDSRIVDIVVANDVDGISALLELLQDDQLRERSSLMRAIFGRIKRMWPSMKDRTKFSIAEKCLLLSHGPTSAEDATPVVQTEAVELLRAVPLTTEILSWCLDDAQAGTKMVTERLPNKRRRTSSSLGSRALMSQVTPELSQALRKFTFVLQLVDKSDPVSHPQLVDDLFSALAELELFRTAVGSELGYLQDLILRSLLAMMPAFKANKELKIGSSGGYGDLLVNCIQKSSSPVVQNSALLLIANLASTAPSLVLHSVMPIFTLMGTSVLRQSDDYSAHVVSQTIKQVVPPLIASLRKGKNGPVAGASDILLSFTTAYDHIPPHRRQGLFVALVETLGPRDFLYALISMLVDRYDNSEALLSFTMELLNNFELKTQLGSFAKVLDLVADLFKPKPGISFVLLGMTKDVDDKEIGKAALRQLSALVSFLGNKRLRSQIGKLADRDDMDAAEVRELYAALLEKVLVLAETVKSDKALHERCGSVLSNLLNLLTIGEFIRAVESLLDRPDFGLRQKVLLALEVRVETESRSDPASRNALLAFLPQLTAAIRESDDIRNKHTAVACIDKIAEKYGKKDMEAVVAAAETIAGEHCLGQGECRLRIMALLCLTSLVDVLQDAVVPILPMAIPQAVKYLQLSLQGGNLDQELHLACYGFVSALAENIPYMLSTYLDRILEVSYRSAESGLGREASESRRSCIEMLARKLDAKDLYGRLDQNWDKAMDAGFTALSEYLAMLSTAIERHSQSSIAKNAKVLQSILMKGFDVRRQIHSRGELDAAGPRELADIETTLNETALKMIYKLNDAAFRPMFVEIVEWTGKGLAKKDKTGRRLRQYSVYGFLESFFVKLKSIVTNYATYVLEDAVKILEGLQPRSLDDRQLWNRVLQVLRTCFENDQDDFWQAPSHFEAVAPVLMEQFMHASTVDLSERLIPAVVELAGAADSQAHQKELNGALMKHLKSESSAVRLAAVKCQQQLTDRHGEEWLSMLHEMLPRISELQEDDDEVVERETHRWIVKIEGVLGESLDAMLQ